VHLEWFRYNSLLKCVSQPEITKNFLKSKNLYFGCSRSFKVIDVGTTGKGVSSACYASLCLSATVLTLDEPIVVK